MKKTHKYCGECIFCTSACPECGSTNVRVKYKVKFEYDNDTEDQIVIHCDHGGIELKCFDCDESFKSLYHNEILKLRDAIKNQLGLSTFTTMFCENESDENGKIKFRVEKKDLVVRLID